MGSRGSCFPDRRLPNSGGLSFRLHYGSNTRLLNDQVRAEVPSSSDVSNLVPSSPERLYQAEFKLCARHEVDIGDGCATQTVPRSCSPVAKEARCPEQGDNKTDERNAGGASARLDSNHDEEKASAADHCGWMSREQVRRCPRIGDVRRWRR
jgi:hypothetical protein